MKKTASSKRNVARHIREWVIQHRSTNLTIPIICRRMSAEGYDIDRDDVIKCLESMLDKKTIRLCADGTWVVPLV